MIQTIKYFAQPTNISCGPTCLMMAYETHPINKNHYSIIEICEMCGTDSLVGTPPERMIKGMVALGMSYKEHIDSKTPFDDLLKVIEKGNIPIVRTITHGIPHWIIVKGFDLKSGYEIYDPALGQITYTQKKLDKIWKSRNHQFFEVLQNEN